MEPPARDARVEPPARDARRRSPAPARSVAQEFGCELFGPTASAVYAVFAVSAVCGVVRGHRGTAIHGSSEAVRAVYTIPSTVAQEFGCEIFSTASATTAASLFPAAV